MNRINKDILLLLLAVLIFFAGYACHRATDAQLHAAFVEGQRDTTGYVEGCSLVDAHAGKCAIPCGTADDCLAKNGSRDNY